MGPVDETNAAQVDGFDKLKKEYIEEAAKWDWSNRISQLVIKHTMSEGIKGAIPEKATAKEFLASIEDHLKGSSKVYATTLMDYLLSAKYNGSGNIREHVMKIINIAARLKTLDMPIYDGFVVHFIMRSLPPQFEAFKVNYNAKSEKWSIRDLIAYCVQEEERLQSEGKNVVNHVSSSNKQKAPKDKGKKENYSPYKKPNQPKNSSSSGGDDACHFCKEKGHYKDDCAQWLKWLAKKGNDVISFIDESLYADFSMNTWWIDSGATVHVSN